MRSNRDLQRNALWRGAVVLAWKLSDSWEIVVDVGLITNAHRAGRARMGYAELGVLHTISKVFRIGGVSANSRSQNFSTHGRSSISQDHALRGCCNTCR